MFEAYPVLPTRVALLKSGETAIQPSGLSLKHRLNLSRETRPPLKGLCSQSSVFLREPNSLAKTLSRAGESGEGCWWYAALPVGGADGIWPVAILKLSSQRCRSRSPSGRWVLGD